MVSFTFAKSFFQKFHRKIIWSTFIHSAARRASPSFLSSPPQQAINVVLDSDHPLYLLPKIRGLPRCNSIKREHCHTRVPHIRKWWRDPSSSSSSSSSSSGFELPPRTNFRTLFRPGNWGMWLPPCFPFWSSVASQVFLFRISSWRMQACPWLPSQNCSPQKTLHNTF